MGAVSGKQHCHFHCCLPYKFGSFWLPLEQILPIKKRPHFGKACPPGKPTRSYENCLPLKIWWKKMEVYP